MKRLILVTIVVLNSFTGWCQNDTIPSTGAVDSVLVPISSIKIANAKMIELEYEKEINIHLNEIIINDSIIIENLNKDIIKIEKDYTNKINKIKLQRNILVGTSVFTLILLVIKLL